MKIPSIITLIALFTLPIAATAGDKGNKPQWKSSQSQMKETHQQQRQNINEMDRDSRKQLLENQKGDRDVLMDERKSEIESQQQMHRPDHGDKEKKAVKP